MLVRYENKPSIPNLWEDFFGPGFMGDIYRKNRVLSLPSANIIEEKDKYFIELAAPGLEKADFKIQLSENVLTVSVEKEENIENTTQREFSY
ncbi:MAG: Hsp20/alpha crystallin family protein, partial [Bacteroidales bacterium]|nr:Hsp20/alpha crystallin family protein [Bacteroidales bacterium]